MSWESYMKVLPISELTLKSIQGAAISAIAKHRYENTAASPDLTNGERLAILVEEVGEAAKCLTYDQDVNDLEKELIQVAAVAAMWIEGLNKHTNPSEKDEQS